MFLLFNRCYTLEMSQICLIFSMVSTIVLAFALRLLAAAVSVDSDLPRLHIYIGYNYNLVTGNPSSSTDPGLMYTMFSQSYTQWYTTPDKKYYIPDDVQSSLRSYCFLQTDPYVFRGSQSYQAALKTKTDLSSVYNNSITSSAFVFSKDYHELQADTISNNKTKTFATARCETYRVWIDLNNLRQLHKMVSFSFLLDVESAVYENKWTNFIDKYGTHFIYDVIMGSTVTQESTFTHEAVSTLNSLGVDLKLAAQAQFAKTYNDSDFDWQKHEKQISYANKFLESRKTVKVGGFLPDDGDVRKWQTNSANAPKPISYKLADYSVLFKLVNNTNFNITKAIESYKAGMEQYCKDKKCPLPVKDRPDPAKATIDVRQTKNVGSEGGTSFSYKKESPTMAVSKVMIKSSTVVNNIQVQLSDGVESVTSPVFGGTGGNVAKWEVPEGEHIQKVIVSYDGQINSLAFITNKNSKSPVFGRFAGEYDVLEFAAGYQMIGIMGRSGAELDKIGFFVRKTIVNYSGKESSASEPGASQEQGEEVKLLQLSLTTS